ncbi:MAG TPA: M14 family metallopeptidase [Pyrinomonadaceae bacterium]|nr:M14 family metallopeptidase [Pyrinomonadaceae bacterium]
MRLPTRELALVFLLPLLFASTAVAQRRAESSSASAARIPAPAEVLGFTPGDDRKLASWNQVLSYFDNLDRASDRVKFEALGKTTMGVPFVMATISTPENLARLDEYKQIQELLADPRKLGPARGRDRKAAELIARGKTIVLITCGIHSTEVGSYLSSMLIAHQLASSNQPEILEVLKNTIILLVPSLNPDGVDIVKNWYDKTLGTPYEGTSPPELYHKYVGHDNNRDWYAFTQVETQITVDKIHNVWHPQIVHDIHQQGEYAARLFLPPYMAPVEPNVPKQIIEGYSELGNFMARELRANAFRGITTNSTYDAWTPARAYSHYHGGVRILSETASARIASPITLKFDQLRSREGYDPQKESEKFGPVWRGGEWNLRDITNYMTSAAFTLLSHASANRERWLSRFYEIGKEAVRPRAAGELRAFVIPYKANDRDGGTRRNALLNILKRGGVETQGVKRFRLNRETFAEGSTIIPLDQPYGLFAKALLERQVYPNLRDAEGHPIQPYDVTSHSLGLLMDVPVTPIYKPIAFKRAQVGAESAWLSGCGQRKVYGLYRSFVPAMDEGWTRWIFEETARSNDCFRYESLTDREVKLGALNKFNALVIPDQPPAGLLNGYRSGAMPPEYTGGLGQAGVKAMREYVEQGGTLVFLNRASSFAIEQFKLPVRNVVAGVTQKEFFVPGSILRLELDTSHAIARGMARETIAWVEDSPVFEVTSGNARIIARYPSNKNPLLSGWLLGDSRIRGRAALVEVSVGKGRIILFGFRPQYRAQSLATYPLLFNAISGN